METLSKIEEIANPQLEKRKKELEAAINNSRALSGIVGMVQSPHFQEDNLHKMIENWNKDQKDEWVGGEVEKEFKTPKGQILKVAMDYQGHIRLSG